LDRGLHHADAFINLAGEPLAGRRWSAAQKSRIRNSRILSTRSIVEAIERLTQRPSLLINASGANYYGSRSNADRVTEQDRPGSDFLARLCVDWEAEALRAAGPSTRVVLLRSGVVLGTGGGALEQMALPFRLFVGGPIGSGSHYFPWIHQADWLRLVLWSIEHDAAVGPLNLSSPHPVRNREFAAAMGKALGRPAVFPVPVFLLRVVFGEVTDMLVASLPVVPARALSLGFEFNYPEILPALEAIFGKPEDETSSASP
jgi:uncharacterized protein